VRVRRTLPTARYLAVSRRIPTRRELARALSALGRLALATAFALLALAVLAWLVWKLLGLALRACVVLLNVSLDGVLGLVSPLTKLVLIPVVMIGSILFPPVEPVEMPTPVPGSRTLSRPFVLGIEVDDSGSTRESDPDSQRYEAIDSILDWIQRYERPEDRVFVVRFTGDATVGPVGPARRIRELEFWGAAQPSLNGTAFNPVAATAGQVFDRLPERFLRVQLLITDGTADDVTDGAPRLAQAADVTHIIALDRGGLWADAKDQWNQRGITISTISNKAPGEIAAELAENLMKVTGERPAD
jgi:hypothetical protein